MFRSLRLAEQEGVGVDLMLRDMVSMGHTVPTIADRGGRVRCVLVGGEPSEAVVGLIASLPQDAQDDVDLALILHVLLERANVSAPELTGLLQKLEPELGGLFVCGAPPLPAGFAEGDCRIPSPAPAPRWGASDQRHR